MNAVKLVDVKNVMSVYSGKSGKCCCGCSGKHTYASATRAAAQAHRGYAVSDEEVNDKVVKLIVNKINTAIAQGVEPDNGGSYIAVDMGTRQWIAYLVPGTAEQLTLSL